ncbi:hypothetical protein GJ496_001455 [Pomphorhynchus laevis]|nr:hypothetical protein GJ496_001455 [Pomphorhynchus laevis]
MSDRIAQLATDFTELFNAFYRAPKYHVAFELMLLLWVMWLILFRKPKPIERRLTEEEREELIAEWKPEPLVPCEQSGDDSEETPLYMTRQIEGPVGHIVTVDKQACVNFATFNFLDLVGSERITKVAIAAVEKYGVGACGPRGFYGTIDIHLELEKRIADIMNVEEAVLYSYAFSTLSSVIPAYAKRGDVIFADRCINYALQKGIQASRSTVFFFNHNDMHDLTRLLEEQRARDQSNSRKAKVTRRFVVVESLYYNTGLVCPLTDIIDLRKEHKFRLILDESLSFGVLGENGFGLCELMNVDRKRDVDILCGSLEYALGSIGGFSCGSSYVVDHQRLSSLGYCFSASLPPLLAASALEAINFLQSDYGRQQLQKLRSLSQYLHRNLLTISELEVIGESFSPVKHIKLSKNNYRKEFKILENWAKFHVNILDKIVMFAQSQRILLTRCSHLPDDSGSDMFGTIRITVSIACSEEEINTLCLVLRRSLIEISKIHNGSSDNDRLKSD